MNDTIVTYMLSIMQLLLTRNHYFAVKFGDGWVEIYPDATAKPPQGTGLNKECDITLHLTDSLAPDQIQKVNIWNLKSSL